MYHHLSKTLNTKDFPNINGKRVCSCQFHTESRLSALCLKLFLWIGIIMEEALENFASRENNINNIFIYIKI